MGLECAQLLPDHTANSQALDQASTRASTWKLVLQGDTKGTFAMGVIGAVLLIILQCILGKSSTTPLPAH